VIQERKREIAFTKGLGWMLKNPQKIEEHVELYANELLFYYLMTKNAEKEKEQFKKILLERLRQSDGFEFKKPTSIYDTGSYVFILGLRIWSRPWERWNDKTDSILLQHIKVDIAANIDLYINHYPLELIFIDYIAQKFELGLPANYRLEFNWWEFLGVPEKKDGRSDNCAELNYYDVLVGYHVTHVVFIDSDYGLRYLDREKYARELKYFLGNMEKFKCNNHVDLVSEFLLCLKVLKATNYRAYKEGMAYIIGSQKDDGSWPQNAYSINNKHTTIVSLLALRQNQAPVLVHLVRP
jgi:hypothetical protein